MCVLALAVQYLAAFWLVALIWPVGLAAVKLVAGWMAGSLIGATQPESELLDDHFKGQAGRALRLIAALVILLVSYTLVTAVQEWIPGNTAIVWGGISDRYGRTAIGDDDPDFAGFLWFVDDRDRI